MGVLDFLKKKKTITGVVRNPSTSSSTYIGGGTAIGGGGFQSMPSNTPGVKAGLIPADKPYNFKAGGGDSGGTTNTTGTYTLPSGDEVPITPETTQAISSGRNDAQVRQIAERQRIQALRSRALAENSSYFTSQEYKEKEKQRLISQGYSPKRASQEVKRSSTQFFKEATEYKNQRRKEEQGSYQEPVKEEKFNFKNYADQYILSQPTKQKALSYKEIVSSSETYPQLFSTLYSQKVPSNVKVNVKNVFNTGKDLFGKLKLNARNVLTINTPLLGLFGTKYNVRQPTGSEVVGGFTLAKIYQTSPFKNEDVQFLMLGVGASPKAVGLQSFKVVEPLRQPNKPVAFETIESELNIGTGKLTRYSKYTIKTEKLPPRISYETSLYEQQWGKPPRNLKFLKSVSSEIRTPFRATANEPFVALETKGGKVGKLSEVSGTSVELDLLKYKELPAQQKFLIKRLAETKTGGIPVSDKNIFKILKKEDLRFLSDIEINQFAKIQLRKGGINLKSITGRKMPKRSNTFYKQNYISVPQTRNLYQTVSETKPMSVPEGIKDVFEFSNTKIVFKDVSLPKGRLYESKIKNVKELDNKIKINKNLDVLGEYGISSGKISIKKQTDISTYLHELFHSRVAKLPKNSPLKQISNKDYYNSQRELKKGGIIKFYKEAGYKTYEIREEAFADMYSFYKINNENPLYLKKLEKKYPITTKIFKNKILNTKEFEYPSLVKYKEGAIKGKTPSLNVYTVEKLEPTVFGETTTNFIQPANIKKTSFDKTFQIQRQTQPTLIRTPPPKVSKATIKYKVVSSPIKTPTYSVSAYTGTGLYERTESVSSFNFGAVSVSPRTSNAMFEPSRNTFKDISILTTPSKSISVEITKTVPKEITKEITKSIPKEINKEVLRTPQKTTQKLSQKLIQKQIQKQTNKLIPPLVPGISYSRTSKRPFKLNFKKGKLPTSSFGKYFVSVRRFGTFKTVGITSTQKQAFQLGQFKTRTTLGATFKVEGLGVKQPLKIPGYKTKPTKQGIFFIEEPKYRLSTRPEVKEINYFKKMKGGRRY